MSHDELLSVGQMAALGCVSVKTLHIYQKKGILEPRAIDSEIGYRYYTQDQCSTLDAVTQLQAIGCSLDEIKQTLEIGEPLFLQQLVQEKLQAANEELLRLSATRALAGRLLNTCHLLLEKPLCDQIMLERLPDRHALVFPVEPVFPSDHLNRQWELAIRHVRQQLAERYPHLPLFCAPSGIIPLRHLEDGSLVTTHACVFVDDQLAEELEGTTVIPGGAYLSMYLDGSLNDDGSSPEYPNIMRMLDYAEKKGFAPCGDYIGETIANTPALSYLSRNSFFRLLLPVKRQGE